MGNFGFDEKREKVGLDHNRRRDKVNVDKIGMVVLAHGRCTGLIKWMEPLMPYVHQWVIVDVGATPDALTSLRHSLPDAKVVVCKRKDLTRADLYAVGLAHLRTRWALHLEPWQQLTAPEQLKDALRYCIANKLTAGTACIASPLGWVDIQPVLFVADLYRMAQADVALPVFDSPSRPQKLGRCLTVDCASPFIDSIKTISAETPYSQGFTALFKGKQREARTHLAMLEFASVDLGHCYAGLIQCALLSSTPADYKHYADLALALNPERPEAYWLHAIRLANKGNAKKAILALQASVKLKMPTLGRTWPGLLSLAKDALLDATKDHIQHNAEQVQLKLL